jgi:peptidoglycan hydrolase-like protein with peptidoglycan-binding domain
MQRRAGNAAVSRLLERERSAATARIYSVPFAQAVVSEVEVQRSVEQEGSPEHRPNLDVGDSGPGVSLLQWMVGATQTGVFDNQTRKAMDRFQRQQGWEPSGVGPMTWAAVDNHAGAPRRRPNLVEGDRGPGVRLLQRMLVVQETGFFGGSTRKAVDALQRAQGWKPSGVGPMTWAALDKVTADSPDKKADDPMQVLVPGTWVDDFKEGIYDIDYRIDEGGSPSAWLQVFYDDGTKVDLNWYDFDDVTLDTTQMTTAIKNRYVGPGGRIVPGRTARNPGRFGLTQQLCPRLWALREDAEEIGAKSTLKLMALSLDAVLFVITVPAMPAGPPAPNGPSRNLKANRRTVSRGARNGGNPPGRPPAPPTGPPAAKVKTARDFYPGHRGEVGTLEAPGRQPMRIKSGEEGGPWGGAQRGGIPRGKSEAFTSGGPSQGNIATHVEGHSAAIMHQQGIQEATLTMGRDQCQVCGRNLPTALPPGSQLKVVHVDEATGQLSETIYRSSQRR